MAIETQERQTAPVAVKRIADAAAALEKAAEYAQKESGYVWNNSDHGSRESLMANAVNNLATVIIAFAAEVRAAAEGAAS